MRLRFIIPVALFLVALALALTAAHRWDHRPGHGPARHHDPIAAPSYDFEDAPPGWMAEVIPMHQAVRRVTRRFDGRVLDIALLPSSSDGPALVYRIRLLTRAGDVLDIRMDALEGRIIELSGADLSGVRRGKHNRKD
ncbi:PepSY domain-containing protein [Paracoccus alkenifer]|uniref:PepSY domain-containing protein n=1 Tax=Paracoccus alkenifer TaxID=65735 RepID=A0A1H6LQZ8_9RHOB|nr:PepSY domain-containing protein [Paracoccus alkenifer]SEH91141.1 hypothetical protein SAMN04488075_1781 [Paracoccus alkenifer]